MTFYQRKRRSCKLFRKRSEAVSKRKDDLITDLIPTALIRSRILEKASEVASHEVIAIGLSEEVVDSKKVFVYIIGNFDMCPHLPVPNDLVIWALFFDWFASLSPVLRMPAHIAYPRRRLTAKK